MCLCPSPVPGHQGPSCKNAVYSAHSHWTALDCEVNNPGGGDGAGEGGEDVLASLR